VSFSDVASRLLPAGLTNVELTLIAFPLALTVALLVAALRIMRVPVVAQIMAVYVDVVRMTPLLLHLFFVFFALPFIGIVLDSWPAAIVTIAFHMGAYQSEAFRSAYLAVPVGLNEAAQVLGMSRWTRLVRVAGPVAIRIAIPPLANTMLETFRATAVVSLVAVNEIVFQGLTLGNQLHQPTETFAIVGFYFLAIGVPGSLSVRWLERRIALP
jgi:cystine transport system permease protein